MRVFFSLFAHISLADLHENEMGRESDSDDDDLLMVSWKSYKKNDSKKKMKKAKKMKRQEKRMRKGKKKTSKRKRIIEDESDVSDDKRQHKIKYMSQVTEVKQEKEDIDERQGSKMKEIEYSLQVDPYLEDEELEEGELGEGEEKREEDEVKKEE